MDTDLIHRQAIKSARQATIEKYGRASVPVTPGTEQHTFWLSVFDKAYTDAIVSWATKMGRMDPA